MADSPFLTVDEVATLLRVPRSCVYAWTSRVGADAIPRYRAGKRLVFRAQEVLDWFTAAQRVGLGPASRAQRVGTCSRTGTTAKARVRTPTRTGDPG